MKFLSRLVLICSLISPAAFAQDMVRGISLTEIGDYLYDASLDPAQKTPAQLMVDRLYSLGFRQINLSPRATMRGPAANEVLPMTPPARRSTERRAYMRLIDYIKSKGMRVGMRPIFFVVDEVGRTPYGEVLPDGTEKIWWHGNIQPADPNAWFESFKTYLDSYLQIAAAARIDEFTIGAELYSMTVGIEDQWEDHPHGFPRQWVDLLAHARSRLGDSVRIMYDINFTDDKILSDQPLEEYGGELARWRYRLADLKDEGNENWALLAQFWTELDAVGIDMYRSLVTERTEIPNDYDQLVSTLQQGAERFAGQIDNALFDIEMAVGQETSLILKEIGYRSVDRGFINPFAYAGSDSRSLNIEHQAAAYEAFLRAFWVPGWSWFKGAVFWDASIDSRLHGPFDLGFSPVGKPKTEEVITRYFAP